MSYTDYFIRNDGKESHKRAKKISGERVHYRKKIKCLSKDRNVKELQRQLENGQINEFDFLKQVGDHSTKLELFETIFTEELRQSQPETTIESIVADENVNITCDMSLVTSPITFEESPKKRKSQKFDKNTKKTIGVTQNRKTIETGSKSRKSNETTAFNVKKEEDNKFCINDEELNESSNSISETADDDLIQWVTFKKEDFLVSNDDDEEKDEDTNPYDFEFLNISDKRSRSSSPESFSNVLQKKRKRLVHKNRYSEVGSSSRIVNHLTKQDNVLSDLLTKTNMIYKSIKHLKSSKNPSLENGMSSDDDSDNKINNDKNTLCKVCFKTNFELFFRPCGHVCCCKDCWKKIKSEGSQCPLCGFKVKVVLDALL